jgi:hypothetical protein
VKEKIDQTLILHSNRAQQLFGKLSSIERNIMPGKYKPYLSGVAHISMKTKELAQFVFGQLSMSSNLLSSFGQDKTELLRNQLDEMIGNVPNSGKEIHSELLKKFYKDMGYGNMENLLIDFSRPETSYVVELFHLDADFKIAKLKLSYLLALLQTIQYLEPSIISGLKNIAVHSVGEGGYPLFPTALPEYLHVHEGMEYYKHPILLKFYQDEKIPSIVDDYCSTIMSNLDRFFGRIDTLIFSESRQVEQPNLVEAN